MIEGLKQERSFQPPVEGESGEIMELRHKTAVAGFEIEKVLEQEVVFKDVDDLNVKLEEIKNQAIEKLEHLSGNDDERVQVKYTEFLKAIAEYIKLKRSGLLKNREINNALEDKNIEMSEEGLGSYFFQVRTGGKPKGVVKCMREDSHFAFVFLDSEDYDDFYEGYGNRKSVSSNSFGRATCLQLVDFVDTDLDLKFNMPCIMIEADNQKDTRDKSLHEKQHFFNRILSSSNLQGKFVNIEVDRENQSTGVWGNIKDEFLARIRGGSDVKASVNFLNTSAYKKIYGGFEDYDESKAKELFEKIEQQLAMAYKVFKSERQRGILTNLLLDVPILKFPEELDRIIKYYKNKEA